MSSPGKADEVPCAAAAPPSIALGTSPSMYLSYGVASLKGRRPELNDTVAAVPSFSAALSPPLGLDYFAVFDGHEGAAVAKYLQKELDGAIAGLIEQELVGPEEPRFLKSVGVAEWWYKTIQLAFLNVDETLVKGNVVAVDVVERVGATALIALVLEEYMVLVNYGFSRAVVSRGGEAVVLSPEQEEQAADIQKWVRLTGCHLSDAKLEKAKWTARVFGCSMYKERGMAPPEVIAVRRQKLEDDFLILASDGVWESLTPAAACTFVRKRLFAKRSKLYVRGSPTLLAKALAEHAIGKGSQGNVSVVLVLFRDFWSQCAVTTPTATGSTAGPSVPAQEPTEAAVPSVPAQEPTKTARARKPNVRLAGPEWDYSHCDSDSDSGSD